MGFVKPPSAPAAVKATKIRKGDDLKGRPGERVVISADARPTNASHAVLLPLVAVSLVSIFVLAMQCQLSWLRASARAPRRCRAARLASARRVGSRLGAREAASEDDDEEEMEEAATNGGDGSAATADRNCGCGGTRRGSWPNTLLPGATPRTYYAAIDGGDELLAFPSASHRPIRVYGGGGSTIPHEAVASR